MEKQIEWYSRAANRNQYFYKGFKITEIVSAATIPVVAATMSGGATNSIVPIFIASVLGGLIVVLEGVQQLFQFHKNLYYRLW